MGEWDAGWIDRGKDKVMQKKLQKTEAVGMRPLTSLIDDKLHLHYNENHGCGCVKELID